MVNRDAGMSTLVLMSEIVTLSNVPSSSVIAIDIGCFDDAAKVMIMLLIDEPLLLGVNCIFTVEALEDIVLSE